MNICILYFSGTGNTKWVINKIKDNLVLRENKVDLYLVDSKFNVDKLSINRYDMLGVAYPIYSSKPPIFIEKALNNIQEVENMPVFFVATAGYATGDVNIYSYNLIKDKGYILIQSVNFVVGNNLHLPILCPLHVTKERTLKRRKKKIIKKCENICDNLMKLKISIQGDNILAKIYGDFQRMIGDKHVGRFFHGFYANSQCKKCGWCVKNCPSNNISLEGDKLIFKDKCMLYMKCYNYCPTQAIQASKKTENLNRYKRYKGI